MSITSSGDIAPAVAPLVARTVALDGPSADLALLTALPRHDALAWIRHGEGIVGWGEVTRITTHGAARFSQAAQWWRDLSEHALVGDEVDHPGTGPIAFGTFAFADHSESESKLVVPEVVLGRKGDTTWITTIGTPAKLTGSVVLEARTVATETSSDREIEHYACRYSA